MTTSVVIPATRPKDLLRIAQALLAQGLAPASLTVVDDSLDGVVTREPPPEPVHMLRSYGSGSSAARNLGARSVSSEWLVFLDDDVSIEDNFWAMLEDFIGRQPDHVGLIEGRVVPVGDVVRPYWTNRVVESSRPGAFLTACLAVRKDAFDAVGGFAARGQIAFREDTEFGLKVCQAGWSHVWWELPGVQHPIETMSLARFLRLAKLFVNDSEFEARFPGYLDGQARIRKFGGVQVRGLRRKLPPVALGASVFLIALRRPLSSLIPLLVMGAILNAAHLDTLRRLGTRTGARAYFDLREISVHACWGTVAGISRGRGRLWRAVRAIQAGRATTTKS